MSLVFGILVFERMTQLDATGPFEALSRVPGARVLLVAKSTRIVTDEHGLKLKPDTDLRRCPKLDLLCVPGGSGVNALLEDEAVLRFVRRQARGARYVTSVCTGSLVLGAAGLLRGRRAACHWLSLPLLAAFGAKPSARRIERDGNLITAGGITSGIDFGLWLAGKIAGPAAGREIQLMMQYDPQPPFRSGTPRQAGGRLAATVRRKRAAFQGERALLVARAAARLSRAGA
ncbi:MAG TPA: DJ-1/PfpI family protein [Opitutaceae bacterium]|nr:DJ-1/PfpI family protein [Opitutaceae bacterium]